MFELKSTLAACLALSAIGGIIACSSQLAKSGSGDAKTSSNPSAANDCKPSNDCGDLVASVHQRTRQVRRSRPPRLNRLPLARNPSPLTIPRGV